MCIKVIFFFLRMHKSYLNLHIKILVRILDNIDLDSE